MQAEMLDALLARMIYIVLITLKGRAIIPYMLLSPITLLLGIRAELAFLSLTYIYTSQWIPICFLITVKPLIIITLAAFCRSEIFITLLDLACCMAYIRDATTMACMVVVSIVYQLANLHYVFGSSHLQDFLKPFEKYIPLIVLFRDSSPSYVSNHLSCLIETAQQKPQVFILVDQQDCLITKIIPGKLISFEIRVAHKTVANDQMLIVNILIRFLSSPTIIGLIFKNNEPTLKATIESNELLFSSSAHEIKNPLNSISSLLELAEESMARTFKEACPIALKYISNAKFSVDHALSIARSLLDIAVVKKRKLSLNYTKVEIRPFMQKMYSTFKDQLRANNVIIVLRIDSKVPQYIYTDKMRLTQVLYNLITNAAKFTENSGTIKLSVKSISYSKLKIVVSDTGIGISQENIAKLGKAFEVLENSDHTKNPYGIGLGLMISKQIASLIGSGLNFSSILQKGTKFWFDVSTGLTENEYENFFTIKKDESPHIRVKQIQKCNSAHIKVGNPCNYRKCSQRKESKFSKQTSATKFSSSIVLHLLGLNNLIY